MAVSISGNSDDVYVGDICFLFSVSKIVSLDGAGIGGGALGCYFLSSRFANEYSTDDISD